MLKSLETTSTIYHEPLVEKSSNPKMNARIMNDHNHSDSNSEDTHDSSAKI